MFLSAIYLYNVDFSNIENSLHESDFHFLQLLDIFVRINIDFCLDRNIITQIYLFQLLFDFHTWNIFTILASKIEIKLKFFTSPLNYIRVDIINLAVLQKLYIINSKLDSRIFP